MKQAAWSIATAATEWIVLWTEAETRDGQAEIPVALINELGAGTNVLVCVDGSDGLVGARQLRAAGDELLASDKRVFVFFADRGVTWNRSRLPGQLRRGLPNVERRVDLARLSEPEAEHLVGILQRRSLLNASSAEDAVRMLLDEDRERWLLPTLMQLTDPEGRGFEGILASVLSGLREEPQRGPLLLLLAASLVQGAGQLLPEDLAERLVRSEGGLGACMESLTAELEAQFGVPRSVLGFAGPPRVVVTHHRVIAESFVGVAAGSADFAERLLEACDALPTAVAEDVTDADLIPPRRFHLLDGVLRFLLGRDPPLHEAADRFLRSLIALDPRQFPAYARLAECDTNWLRAETRRDNVDRRLVEWLAESARAAFAEALKVARSVLAEGAVRPRPYVGYELRHEEEIFLHGWGVLEDTIGQRSGDVPTLTRAVMLFLEAGDDRALSTLPLPLIHLGELKRAAIAAAVFRAVAVSDHDRGIVRKQERLLRSVGESPLSGGLELADGLIADLVLNLLLPAADEIQLYPDGEAHQAALLTVLQRFSQRLENTDEIDAALAALSQ